MKMLLLFLIATLLCAEPDRNALKSIEPDAIIFGTGLNQVYVFVDPLCPNSRNFIDTIESNHKIQKENTYYVFLYRLKMFRSDGVINAIYQAKDKKRALLNVMVRKLPIATQNDDLVKDVRDRINVVAKELNMKNRPYLLTYPHGSNYCKVSEGKAACMLQAEK